MKKLIFLLLIIASVGATAQTTLLTGLKVGPKTNANRVKIDYIDYTGGVLRIVVGGTNYLDGPKISGLNNVTNESKATMFTAPTFTGTSTFSGAVGLGTNNLTLTGSIGATGARVTKLWATNAEFTNMPTVAGVTILTDTTTLSTAISELPYLTIPVKTTAERDALSGMPAGSVILNSTTGKLNYYSGSAWQAVTKD